MGALEQRMPAEIRKRAVPVGAELLLSYADVLTMIDVACAAGIAVLGVEAFQVDPDGLRPLEYSSYEVNSTVAWNDFVCQNGEYARAFVKAHPLGEEHGYLLTATSEDEGSLQDETWRSF